MGYVVIRGGTAQAYSDVIVLDADILDQPMWDTSKHELIQFYLDAMIAAQYGLAEEAALRLADLARYYGRGDE